jgi:dTDP-4-dehydrorhamnose 3,5-epimerase
MQPKLIQGGLTVDDRGQLAFVNDFDFNRVKRFYLVSNHRRGFVRAWHGHKREQKYVLVVRGAALVRLVALEHGDDKSRPWTLSHVLSEKKPAVLHIPAGYFNGFMTLTDDTQLMFFSTATLDESAADDIRLPADKWGSWEVEER